MLCRKKPSCKAPASALEVAAAGETWLALTWAGALVWGYYKGSLKAYYKGSFKGSIGFRALGLGCRIWGSGFRALGFGLRVWGLGFRV